jgi:muramoyltetrapeptide carboxypeptidase
MNQARSRPPRLRPGDAVAVVSPASPVPEGRLDRGLDVLRSWGLDILEQPRVRGAHPRLDYLAAADEQRAEDLQSAWTDPDVRAVFAARGGYGVQRLLDHLDYDAIAAAGPKILVGYSDLTALHQALAARLGLVTVHGPVLTSLGGGDDQTREHLRRLLFEPSAGPLLTGLTDVVGGRAVGPVVGGNLALLASGIGTRDLVPATGRIALMEDVAEPPYRIDRMLTQLIRSGWFDGVAGVVVGDFTAADLWSLDEPPPTSDEVLDVVVERLAPLGVPLITGAPVGHGPRNLAVPLGVPAVLDADEGTLSLSEAPFE